VAIAALLAYINLCGVARAQTTTKTFIDYLKPTPITCSPLSSATWGVAGVLPRDLCNGIESAKGETNVDNLATLCTLCRMRHNACVMHVIQIVTKRTDSCDGRSRRVSQRDPRS
jgi:hypothetical protein